MAHNCTHVDPAYGACTLAWHRNGGHVYFGRPEVLTPTSVQVQPDQITRLEVVGPQGRDFVLWDADVTLSVQDNGRTLKVFWRSKEPGDAP